MPTFFLTVMMYILGASLVVAGVYQIVEYRSYADVVNTPFLMYATSVLVLLSGVFIFLNPIESASLPFIVLGVSSLVYGIAEIVKAFKFRNVQKNEPHAVEEAEEVEEVEATQIADKTYCDEDFQE